MGARDASRPAHVKRLEAFFADVDDDFNYTYERKVPPKDSPRVERAIVAAMAGFCDVVVRHVKGNEYTVSSTGPDEYTSREARNLASLGELKGSKYTVRMVSGGYTWP